MKTQQTILELVGEFESQLTFLRSHCRNFDDGQTIFYKEIASTLRILLHETNSQIPLIKHLELTKMPFINSGNVFNENNIMPFFALVWSETVFSDSGAITRFAPCLNREISILGFNHWWSDQIVLRDIKRNTFTRKDLVTISANQDGGAHVDKKIATPYYEVSRKGTAGALKKDSMHETVLSFQSLGSNLKDESTHPMNPIPPTIRQIADEVVRSIERYVTIIKSTDEKVTIAIRT
jgi:hypothetical protein